VDTKPREDKARFTPPAKVERKEPEPIKSFEQVVEEHVDSDDSGDTGFGAGIL
jgi:hypothetical protein